MQVIYRMAVRNMLPEVINKAAQMSGRPLSAEEQAAFRKGTGVTVLPGAPPSEHQLDQSLA